MTGVRFSSLTGPLGGPPPSAVRTLQAPAVALGARWTKPVPPLGLRDAAQAASGNGSAGRPHRR